MPAPMASAAAWIAPHCLELTIPTVAKWPEMGDMVIKAVDDIDHTDVKMEKLGSCQLRLVGERCGACRATTKWKVLPCRSGNFHHRLVVINCVALELPFT
jgi:hypothetical protein